MLDPLENEDKYILINAGKYSNSAAYDYSRINALGANPLQANQRFATKNVKGRKLLPVTEVQKVDVQSGSRTAVARIPFSNVGFVTDHAGEVRFATAFGSERFVKNFYRKDKKTDWVLMNDQKESGLVIKPIGFDKNNSIAYLKQHESTGPDSVYAYDTNTSVKTLLVRDNKVNPGSYLFSPVDNTLFAIIFYEAYPRIHYVDPQNISAQALKTVAATFKVNTAIPVSYTSDGNTGLYFVSGENMPGEYYLYNQSAKKIGFVAGKN